MNQFYFKKGILGLIILSTISLTYADFYTNLKASYSFSNGNYLKDSYSVYDFGSAGSSVQISSGFSGYGASSGASSGYIGTSTNNYGIAGNGNITMAGWFKMSTDISTGGCGLIFQGSTLTLDNTMSLDYEYNGGTRRLRMRSTSQVYYNFTMGTTWHHLAMTRSGGVVSLYVDGVFAGSDTNGSFAGTTNALYLFTGGAYGGNTLEQGDELSVWGRALSGTEIKNLYNGGTGLLFPFPSSTPSSAGFFKFFKYR